MSKQKIVWRSIGIPLRLFKKLKELIVKTGDPSVAEYIRFAVKVRMQSDLDELEEQRLEDERTRI